MVVFGRGAEDRAVLKRAEDGVQTFVGLKGDMLCILVADGTEPSPHITDLNERTAQPAGGLGAGSHARTL